MKFIQFSGTKTNLKKCNMIDTNPESSISGSNSNSMISKTPTSVQVLAGDGVKDDLTGDLDRTSNCLTLRPGSGTCNYGKLPCQIGKEFHSLFFLNECR